MGVSFEITNTNDEPLRLMTYNYTVTANGMAVFTGKFAAEQTVPRWSSIESTIPIVIRRHTIQGASKITWQLSGSLGFIPPTAFSETLRNVGLWRPTISIRGHGAVPVPPLDLSAMMTPYNRDDPHTLFDYSERLVRRIVFLSDTYRPTPSNTDGHSYGY